MRLCKLALLLTAFALSLPVSLFAQNSNELDRTVKAVCAEKGMDHALLAVNVYNISRHRNIYSHNASLSLVPASLQKVFTTAVAFDQLGTDFRFKTSLAHDGSIDANGTLNGNLYVIGGGDPLLGSYRYKQTTPDSLFHTWMAALRQAGIRRIAGRICYNQSIFDNNQLHDGWQWGDVGNYFGAGVCGLNFHENMYFVYFNAGNAVGAPATIDHLSPSSIEVHSLNEVTTGESGTGDRVTIYGDPVSHQRTLRGTVPLGAKNFSVRGAMPSPAATCADLFAVFLRQHGISVSQSSREATTVPRDAVILLEYHSGPYATLAQYTNHTSNNIYAESIFKFLGYYRYGLGSFANGSRVVGDFFRTHNLSDAGVRIADGSGLSRTNLVTADFMCRFLAEVSNMLIYDDFAATLPEAGKSGTARNMLKSLPANVKVRLKSGTMEGVRNYCGYVTTAKGEQLCFCLLLNNHTATSASKQLEKILSQIALLN